MFQVDDSKMPVIPPHMLIEAQAMGMQGVATMKWVQLLLQASAAMRWVQSQCAHSAGILIGMVHAWVGLRVCGWSVHEVGVQMGLGGAGLSVHKMAALWVQTRLKWCENM
ncbi:hypothetical protein B0H10DRAFT_1941776 [Mycena sp. CBHHK59/15]|nr:hypothetical protein B0H10DRAFT_1941776 [Mycena sp. CBHHK59/15]